MTNYLSITKEYNYRLSYVINNETITNDLFVTYGGLTPEDAIKNSLANQSNLIREQNANQEIIINQNSEIIEQQQATTNSINDLNDNITDDTITSSASDLPSNNTNDITRDGIDTIFQSIYNAFCTGQPQDIIFPIPFTNKNITLSPYYVRDMLTNSGATWIITLINAFWGYLIGRYIVKDVMNKINAIKSGNIENIERTNIKGDML